MVDDTNKLYQSYLNVKLLSDTSIILYVIGTYHI